MPLDTTPMTGSTGSANIDEKSPTGAGINTPDLSVKTLKPGRRAITDVGHVFLIIANLIEARRSQSEKNGRIAAKINAERPYVDATLESEGLGYKSNFSTKPMSTTLSKVGARLVKAIQSARYLTAAQLPDSIVSGKEKTELFRNEVTNLIRRWDGWFEFISTIAGEDSTYGWACAAWLDTQDWRPKSYRQDEAFFPDGTGHAVETVQVVALRRFVQMHELAEFIFDKEAATAAGWDIENTVESINNARPPNLTGNPTAANADARRYEDAIRESSVSLTLVNGSKQIEIYDVFATEIDGKVSHYIVDYNTKKLLFEKEDRYKDIKTCLRLFSYEQSNGKLMGSKGVGREIYEIASALDRCRNEAVDRLQMSGKIIMSGPESQIDRFKLTSLGNVAIIPEGFTISQVKIEADVEGFQILEQLLTSLLDQIAGSVTPKQLPGERVTAAQVNLVAEREEEKRDDRDTRFIIQIANTVTTMTRRAFSSECTDDEAKAAKEKLLRSMSKEELDMLLEQPALRTIEDFTEMDAQKIVAFAAEHKGDPRYNQQKLAMQSAAALIDAEFAADVVLPENDPTVQAEQSRQQELENLLFDASRPAAVSPRDDHNIHILVLKDALAQLVPAAVKGDLKALQVAPAFLQHWADHIAAAREAGVDEKSLAPSEKELADLSKQIGELQSHAELTLNAQKNGQPSPPPLPPPKNDKPTVAETAAQGSAGAPLA